VSDPAPTLIVCKNPFAGLIMEMSPETVNELVVDIASVALALMMLVNEIEAHAAGAVTVTVTARSMKTTSPAIG
jgi:hypothetical protein